MSIPADAYCLRCYVNKYIPLAHRLGDMSTADAFAKALVQLYLELPPEGNSCILAQKTAELLQKFYNLDPDRYRAEKEAANAFVLARMDSIREKVFSAPDPVLAGLQAAILGNYLDFSALGSSVSFDDLDAMLDKAFEMELDSQTYARFRRELDGAKKLLYLTDNAGEIGFDRIFGEALRQGYPDLEITFCVRGGITINDATREDAALVGLDFPVIDNGNLVPGTELSLLSQEAKAAMDSADVILSKGMGNTETLYGCGYPIFYAFLIKCEKFVRLFDKPMMTPMFLREG